VLIKRAVLDRIVADQPRGRRVLVHLQEADRRG
jgi:hypothetical protein